MILLSILGYKFLIAMASALGYFTGQFLVKTAIKRLPSLKERIRDLRNKVTDDSQLSMA